MPEALTLERRGAVAIISIHDAPYNRMTLEYMDQLEVSLGELEHDDRIRALVFTGDGTDNFSVGMNLKQMPDGIKAKGSIDGVFDQRWRVLEKIENLGKPSVATLFGYCLGGGLELPSPATSDLLPLPVPKLVCQRWIWVPCLPGVAPHASLDVWVEITPSI